MARSLAVPSGKAVDTISNGNASTTNRIAVADGGRGAIVMERVRMAFNDAELLALNLDVARRKEAGELVPAPGILPGHTDPTRLVTDDCVRAF